jgi:hypothetical protein
MSMNDSLFRTQQFQTFSGAGWGSGEARVHYECEGKRFAGWCPAKSGHLVFLVSNSEGWSSTFVVGLLLGLTA